MQITLHRDHDHLMTELAALQDLPRTTIPTRQLSAYPLVMGDDELFADLLRADLAQGDGFALLCREGAAAALVTTYGLAFDTACFELPMARIGQITMWGGEAAAGLATTAVARALERMADGGVRIVLGQAPSGDPAVETLVRSGFAPTGRRYTYSHIAADSSSPRKLRRVHAVRHFEDRDLPHLLRLAGRLRVGQYHRIPELAPEQVRNFYEQWIRLACRGNFADGVLVALQRDVPVGFLSHKHVEWIERASGLQVGGRGLAAVDESVVGAGVSLVAGTLELLFGPDGYDIGEYDVDSANEPFRRVLEGFRLHCTRRLDTFYKALP
jgi:hypothetical protein